MKNKRRDRFIAYFNGPPLRGDRARLIERTGLTKGRVTQILDEDQPFGEKAAQAMAEKLGLPGDYFETDAYIGGVPEREKGLTVMLGAGTVHDAQLVTWERILMKEPLPPMFWVALPDNAMAPRAPMGKLICFDTTMAPAPGDGVLLMDRDGGAYFRRYAAGVGGRWTGQALNPAFADLDSERDGLHVLAVLKSEEGRWA